MPGEFRRIGIKVPPTSTELEAHDVAYRVLSRGAVNAGTRFRDPDDDWRPMWLILTREHGTVVTPGGGVDKYAMVDYVAALTRRWGAIAAGHLHSSWAVRMPEERRAADELVEVVRSRGGSTEGLERDEILLLATYSATMARQYHAPIRRRDHAPPVLDPFELMINTDDREHDARVSGAMADPILGALARVG
jgi:hypothetical protein